MRQLNLRASAIYSGRIEAELSLGDIIVLIDDHGAVVVYDLTKIGMLPRNWMPPQSVVTETEGGLEITYAPRGEKLEIFIDHVYSDVVIEATMPTKLTKRGAEQEVADMLAQDIEALGENLEVFDGSREYRTKAGPIDLLLVDPDGEPVVVEVKRSPSNPIGSSAVAQVRKYQRALLDDPAWSHAKRIRGILVGPVLSKPARAEIETDPDLTFIRLSYNDLVARSEAR